MFKRFLVFVVASLLTFESPASSIGHRRTEPTLSPQSSGTTQLLISVSAVNERIVWASGAGGTFVVTTDGGAHWRSGVVPGAEKLQFRDVQAVSAKVAYLLSIGNEPGDFRIYKTSDGGAHWTMQFQNERKGAFYDCFAFWTSRHGLAHSDSVEGAFPDLLTSDGEHWHSIAADLPPALPSEGSFASSGTCVTTEGDRNAWIVTGSSAKARVLATRNGGRKWQPFETPLPSGDGTGAFTVAFRDSLHGVVGGGSIDIKKTGPARFARSSDGGRSWTLTKDPPLQGAIFGAAYAGEGRTVLATANAGGVAWTPDEGDSWFKIPGVSGYWGVTFAGKLGWLVGTNGRILKVSF